MKQSNNSSATQSMISSSQQKLPKTGPTRPTSSSDGLLGSEATSSDPVPGELRRLLEQLAQEQENLTDLITCLEPRLSDVLSPPSDVVNSTAMPMVAANTPIGYFIMNLIERVALLRHRIDSLISRLAT